jgi:hypothetical protein
MIPGHPNTVGASPIPLYMQGFKPISYHLGQDLMDPSTYDPGFDLVPPVDGTFELLPSIPAVTPIDTASELSPGGTLIAPPTPPSPSAAPAMQPALTPSQLTQLYQSAGAAGTMTPAQVNSAIAQLAAGAGAVATAAAGPAPRVTLPAVVATAPNPLTASTVIPGVPNYILLAAAAIAAVAMGSK